MSESSLKNIGETEKITILPGLVLEDKIRIKTQRRLEKHFGLPISRIFKGEVKDSEGKTIQSWDGVDFNFINNAIPMLAILAKQVDEKITESYIEDILDKCEDDLALMKNLEKYFKVINEDKPKN